jgi:hypothetical protein
MKVKLCFINFLDSFNPKLVFDYFYIVLLVLLFPLRQNILQALNSKQKHYFFNNKSPVFMKSKNCMGLNIVK